MIREAIEKLLAGADLTEQEAAQVMEEIMDATASSVLMSAYLVALRAKGESIRELVGSARVMRDHALRVELEGIDAIDMCGTGGDGKGTFNISTTAVFVVAGAGLPVAKHGNRAASSRCGSADLLEQLGAVVALSPEHVSKCIRETRVGFMFAPAYHPAMKNVMPVRRELKVRTIFNLLGPLTNPARVKAQLLGVFRKDLTGPIASVLTGLGARSACVVHGDGGYDEVTTLGSSTVSRLRSGKVETYTLDPREYGFSLAEPEALAGGTVEENVRITLEVLSGEEGPCRDTVLLNAGLALLVGGKADDLVGALELAREAIDSGKAKKTLDNFIKLTQSLSGNAP